MLGVFRDTVYRANLHALRVVVPADAFGAIFPVYDINVISLGNGFVGALRFTYTAVHAIIGD